MGTLRGHVSRDPNAEYGGMLWRYEVRHSSGLIAWKGGRRTWQEAMHAIGEVAVYNESTDGTGIDFLLTEIRHTAALALDALEDEDGGNLRHEVNNLHQITTELHRRVQDM